MKPEASPEYALSNLSGSGVRGRLGRAHARRPPLSLRDISPAPRGNLPLYPTAHPFLVEEKDAKDHSGGVCGLPLKTPGGSLRSQRYIRYAPRVRVSAGWYALTMLGAAQRCGTSFQRLVCVDPPVRKCLRISERLRAFVAHRSRKRQNVCAVRAGGKSVPW